MILYYIANSEAFLRTINFRTHPKFLKSAILIFTHHDKFNQIKIKVTNENVTIAIRGSSYGSSQITVSSIQYPDEITIGSNLTSPEFQNKIKGTFITWIWDNRAFGLQLGTIEEACKFNDVIKDLQCG